MSHRPLSRVALASKMASLDMPSIVNNPNAGYAIENSQLQVALYDDAGNAIGTDSGTIGLILPGAKRPVSGVITVPDGETPPNLTFSSCPVSTWRRLRQTC